MTFIFSGRPAVQGEHICNSDPEGFPVCGGEQGPGPQRAGEGQGPGGPPQGRREAEERENEGSEGQGEIRPVHTR